MASFLENGRRGRGFGQLLRDFHPAEQATPPDAVQERLEKRLQAARQALVDADLSARRHSVPMTGTPSRSECSVVAMASHAWPARVTGRCWPISLPAMGAVALQLDQ